MKITIVIPAYNEEKRIGSTLEEYGRFFSKLKKEKNIETEILVVINNTRDRTEEIVKTYSKKYPIIKWLNFKQGGKGFAIIEGFKHSLKEENDLIGFVDADLATEAEPFYDLIRFMGRYDGAIASRWIPGSIIKTKQSIVRRITSFGFNLLVRFLLFLPYADTQCGAKIFKREAIESITGELGVTQWAFDIDLLYKLKKKGFKIREVKTTWEDKKDSKLKVLRTTLQMFLAVIRLRLINSPLEPILRPVKIILKIGDRLINKKSQSQQAVGYFLSLKLGRRTNYRSELRGIAPSLSNK